MGPWNMLEFAQTALSFRGATLGGFVSPSVGPPDEVNTRPEPDEELPESNIAEWERGRAVQRERERRMARRGDED
jgi:hypothetical protein